MSTSNTVNKPKTPKYTPRPKKVPRFLRQLYSLMTSPEVSSYVTWLTDSQGVYNTFRVEDSDAFAQQVLPQFFKHNKFLSFVRQLHIYGFRKVYVKGTEFTNPFFVRGQPELMKQIKRNAKDNTERKYVKKNKGKAKKKTASKPKPTKQATTNIAPVDQKMLIEQVNMLKSDLEVAVHQANFATTALASLMGVVNTETTERNAKHQQVEPQMEERSAKREQIESQIEEPSAKRRRVESTDSSQSTVSEVWPSLESQSFVTTGSNWDHMMNGSSSTASGSMFEFESVANGYLTPEMWSSNVHLYDDSSAEQSMVSSPLSTTSMSSMNSTQNLPASPYSPIGSEYAASCKTENNAMVLEEAPSTLSLSEPSTTLSESSSFDIDFTSMPKAFQFSTMDDTLGFDMGSHNLDSSFNMMSTFGNDLF